MKGGVVILKLRILFTYKSVRCFKSQWNRNTNWEQIFLYLVFSGIKQKSEVVIHFFLK